ncbi:MAG TPA: porin family protein [Chitinophagaceae bacterium]|nr:porin family protein [Chitinophagaceae bacterium]
MKKTILALLLLAGTASFAQNITGGIKAGANISNFTGGNFDAVKKKALVGFHAGGYLNFALGGVSIQPELLVSTAGAKFEDIDDKVTLTYISVPVMVKFKSAGGFYIEAGPQVGFKISEDTKNETIDHFAKDLDLAVGAGLGFESKAGLGIGARYMAGLSKVGDFDSGSIDPDFKNSVIQVGLSFRLGK